jgi:hypothetical protein
MRQVKTMKNKAKETLAALAVVVGMLMAKEMAKEGQMYAERITQYLSRRNDRNPTPSLSKNENRSEILNTDGSSIREKIPLEELNGGQRYCIRYQATIYDAKKSLHNPAYVVETTKWVTGNGSTQTTEIACPLPSELKGKDLSETMIIKGLETGRYRVFTASTGSKEIRMYEFMNGRSSGEDIRQLTEKPKLPEEAEREDKE